MASLPPITAVTSLRPSATAVYYTSLTSKSSSLSLHFLFLYLLNKLQFRLLHFAFPPSVAALSILSNYGSSFPFSFFPTETRSPVSAVLADPNESEIPSVINQRLFNDSIFMRKETPKET